MSLNHFFYDHIFSHLPKKWMSHCLGAAAHLSVPKRVNNKIIKSFASHYKINVDEASKSIEEYKSLGDFFARELKQGARPIEGDVVHPCDGVLIESGKINENVLIQAKGKSFRLEKFVPENPWSELFEGGSFFTYYLAPHNYHRVHSPVTGVIKWSTVVPGELWPVNSWSVKNVDGLYAINERVVSGIETPQGKVILVMVGATNVGSISMTYDQNIKTNKPGKKEIVHREYTEGRPITVGGELGTFHLGSTVVLLFEKSWEYTHRKSIEVKMGQSFN